MKETDGLMEDGFTTISDDSRIALGLKNGLFHACFTEFNLSATQPKPMLLGHEERACYRNCTFYAHHIQADNDTGLHVVTLTFKKVNRSTTENFRPVMSTVLFYEII